MSLPDKWPTLPAPLPYVSWSSLGRRVGLAQLIRFLVVKLTYICSNFKFDMGVTFTTNYFLVGDNVLIDSKTLLITDFVNLNRSSRLNLLEVTI
jgi:hypothetical protein